MINFEQVQILNNIEPVVISLPLRAFLSCQLLEWRHLPPCMKL